jgi:hypothetical protein
MNLFRPKGGVVEAAQWNGGNSEDVRNLLGDSAFPPIGWFVVRRSGGVEVIPPTDFAARYEPI